jgi:hypothetical protein
MEPSIWGKHGWIFLHSVTMAYPDNPTLEDKQNFKTFFNLLRHTLPCNVCKVNYGKHWDSNPPKGVFDSKRSLVEWFIGIHNTANKFAKKPILTYDQVIDHYKILYKTGELPNSMTASSPIISKQEITKQLEKSANNTIIYIYLIILLIFLVAGIGIKMTYFNA